MTPQPDEQVPFAVGEAHLRRCRELLGAPPRAALWWAGLTRGEQRLLIVGGCLTASFIGAPWDEIDEGEQREIIEVARRASRWAAELVDRLEEGE